MKISQQFLSTAQPPNNSPIQMNTDAADTRGPVRNLAPVAGQEITTIRYWKIKKGSFPQFLKASQEGVWPYFEKIGSRIVGVVNRQLGIASFSPRLDAKGNSARGVGAFKALAEHFGLHAFDCTNIGSSFISSLIR